MFSTSPCSTVRYLLPPATRHMIRSRWWLTTLTNGKLTGSSTQNDITRSYIILYNGCVTVTHILTWRLRKMSGILTIWLTSFSEIIQGSPDDDWSFSMGVLLCFLSYGCQAGINSVGIGFYHPPLGVEFPHAPNAA